MYYTDRLMLRALDPGCDSKVFVQMFNDVEYLASLRGDAAKPISAARGKEDCEKWTKEAEEKGWPIFAICLKPIFDGALPAHLGPDEDLFVKDGQARYPLIGMLNLRSTGHGGFTTRSAGFGIIFTREHTSKGYGTEVLQWACKYVFDTMGQHRFELRTARSNERAIKCYEKVGFVREGVHREGLFRDGKFVDYIVMAMLEQDWRKANEDAS